MREGGKDGGGWWTEGEGMWLKIRKDEKRGWGGEGPGEKVGGGQDGGREGKEMGRAMGGGGGRG